MIHPGRSLVAGCAILCGLVFLSRDVARSAAAEPKLVARPDAFQTLVNPNCSHCIDEAKARAGELRDDDPVLAWTRGKYQGGAIPIRFFLNPFRVISDTYGVFVFDPDAGFARGYEPSLDFTFYGWRNGIVVMRHKDGTLFSTLSGRGFDGPRKGERLKPISTCTTTWGYWNKSYPGSVAYRMLEKYQPVELSTQDNAESKQSRPPVDRRLAENTEILGVSIGEVHKAYPLGALPTGGGVIHDTLGGKNIAIAWYPATRTASAYSTELEEADESQEVKLAFDAAQPDAPFIDRHSGSRFGVEGRAVSGPLKGKALTWIDSVQCRWFAWAAEYPETTLHDADSAETRKTDAQSAVPIGKTTEMVLVAAATVTPDQIERWRSEGFQAIVAVLDDECPLDVYRSAAAAAEGAKMALYYWIEVARNARMAQEHPRWMASLGMHDDWARRFAGQTLPRKGEVAKAYPWVPIGYAEAFEAHLQRIERLLEKVPDSYRGVLLNDLQGGPASCGCGNLQCRWAIDYGVPATATKQDADDAAARFVSRVGDLARGKQIVPVWMTECEQRDLPADKAPARKSTGLCGSVGCATSTCPRVFAKQLSALQSAHSGPLGLLTAQRACGRDVEAYGGPTGWIAAAVDYLDGTPLRQRLGVPHDQLWLVVQGAPERPEVEATARRTARDLNSGAVIAARVPLDQSYEPRVIAAE